MAICSYNIFHVVYLFNLLENIDEEEKRNVQIEIVFQQFFKFIFIRNGNINYTWQRIQSKYEWLWTMWFFDYIGIQISERVLLWIENDIDNGNHTGFRSDKNDKIFNRPNRSQK